MIERLRIRGLGVIEAAEIEFGPGLTAITGETGAGKTMVLTGLGLLAGARADPGAVRRGGDRAEVDGEWWITQSAVRVSLEAAGAELDAGDGGAALVLGRSIAAGGRSRATIGGRPVGVGALETLAGLLVAVHGQSDQLRIRQAAQQRELLDRFGSCGDVRATYAAAYAQWREAERSLAELRSAAEVGAREVEALVAGIADIEAVGPEPGEDQRLDAEAKVLANSGALAEDIESARMAVADDVLALLARAQRDLERAAAIDPQLAELATRIAEASTHLGELAVDLAAYGSGLDADPTRQAWVEQRRSELSALRRRYGSTIDDVLDWLARAQERLALVEGSDEREAELVEQARAGRERAWKAAAQLTKARERAARTLERRVSEELQALAMPDAQLSIALESVSDAGDLGPHGADEVTFLLRPHAGAEPRPIGRGASGGELSRIMLAIEVALAGADPVPTFVFDEVDAGIGGRAAVEVGRRLARLADTSQVVVVTHLPQVAAFADHHVVVSKGSDGSVTATSVREVTGEERVAELVRMLSGLEATQAGAEHARELLEVASADRSERRVAPGVGH